MYRDKNDQYISRKFDFTSSLNEFLKNLKAQRANGGGDTPEAMHTALNDATELSWRGEKTARVLFLLADAPPHNQDINATFTAVKTLKTEGVKLFPVASSDTNKTAEYVMRTSAFMTLGHYLFLTDDSGVGGKHAKPSARSYYVQRLNQLIIRMIASELAGKLIQPKKEDIIRTVGNPINPPKAADKPDAPKDD